MLDPQYPLLRYLVMIDQGDYLSPLRIVLHDDDPHNLVITFDELLRRTPFAKRLSRMLQILENEYGSPVDTEFTLRIIDPEECTARCRNHTAAVPTAKPSKGK